MSYEDLIKRLVGLTSGESIVLPYVTCDGMFHPGLQTVPGRQHMYDSAAATNCSVHWHEEANIEFRKR